MKKISISIIAGASLLFGSGLNNVKSINILMIFIIITW